MTKEQNAEVITLLKLMGIPVVQAPGEAEAQCASMCNEGAVFGAATEDMDALTFGTKRLLRHMTFSAARKVLRLPTRSSVSPHSPHDLPSDSGACAPVSIADAHHGDFPERAPRAAGDQIGRAHV